MFEIVSALALVVYNSLHLVAPYDVNATGNNMYPQGEQLILNCQSEGGPQLEYIWMFLNSQIASTANLTIDNVNAVNEGNYSCNVTNDAGTGIDTITVYSKFIYIRTYTYLA